MKRIYYLILTCALIAPAFAAPKKAGISPEAAQRDFKIMNAIFARSHAVAFAQIPAREAPVLFDGDSLVTPNVFLANILSYYRRIRVDHTMVGFTPDLIEEYGLKSRFFPFPLKFFDNRAYADVRMKDIPFGGELTHINGKELPGILSGFSAFPRAGSGDKYWDAYYLTEQFSVWYLLGAEAGAPWLLRFAGREKELAIDAVPANTRRASTDREYMKPVLHSMFLDTKKIAYFAINSFIPAGSPFASLEKWMEYFGQFNTEARSREATTLILDLRMNRGGVMQLAAASASWFTEEPVRDMSTSSVHTRLLPYREFAIAINGQRARSEHFDMLEKHLRAEFSDTSKEGYFGTKDPEARFVSITPLKNIHRFQKIYILIGPSTYSAGVYFARLVKLGNPNVILAGSETGSAGDGHTAEMLVTYRLPESGILFDVPLARVRFAPLVKDQKPGRGLMPDMPLYESLADFRAGRDGVLESVVNAVPKP